MARIPIPDPGTMPPDQRRVYDAVVSGPRGAVVGPLLAALHRPELADKWQQFGALLRYDTCLPARLNELAILVCARHWNAQTEWYIHARAAAQAGLEGAIIDAIRSGKRPTFESAADQTVYDFARLLVSAGRMPASLHEAVQTEWGTIGVVELTALVGYYTMVAMTLNAHELPVPDGAPPPLAVPTHHDDRPGDDLVSGLPVPSDTLAATER